ncbi:hypothetical protein IV203_025933 [Nitzschia inconspicua]|uniref:Uncharacterized protein n=1 Tax=Nitzschia inconspicua TaxID=303405 RepID=A0A9K3K629_9STRA|nr:hypothetical protein IV203_017754 [Nitzschia inconspicua]KAG7362267.1 hypothetical protein IV203_025933 [Nitzschia inconspicua]
MSLEASSNSTAAQLNNEGVKEWTRGSYTLACDSFCSALKASRAQVATGRSSSSMTTKTSRSLLSHHFLDGAGVSRNDTLPFQIGIGAFRNYQITTDCLHALPLYCQPIEISDLPTQDDIIDQAIACSVILFNIGLSHHTEAMRESIVAPGITSEKFIKAEALYEFALQLRCSPSVSESWGDMCDIQKAILDMITLASLNNLIQLSAMEHDRCFPRIEVHAFHLSHFISSITATRYHCQVISDIMISQREIFLENLISAFPSFSAAAA